MILCDAEGRERDLGTVEFCSSSPADPWLLKAITSQGLVLKMMIGDGELLLVALEAALDALHKEQNVHG